MTERKLVPKIRFKRFEEEWLKTDFGKIVFRNSATTDSKELRSVEYENINSEYGTVTKSYNNKKGIKFKKGDVLFGKLRPYLKNWILTCFEGKAVGDFWVLSSRKGFDSSFVFYLIQTNRFAFISNITTGTKMPRSDWNLVSNTSFDIPIRSEQQKIGALFAKLDQLLDLQHQKLDQLELLKKALLQKLFPKQGTEIPELRFKGFEDEWKTNALQEISKIVGGGTPDTNKAEYWNGDINWYSPTEIGKKPFAYSSNKKISKIGLKKSSAKLLPANKTVLFTSRAGIGDMAILKTPAATNQGFQSLELKDNVYPYFVYSYGFEIKRKAKKLASGSTFLEISNKDMKRITLEFPNVKEQQKIGTFFAKIDRLIELENKKIDNLKQVKKSLLQNMFVE